MGADGRQTVRWRLSAAACAAVLLGGCAADGPETIGDFVESTVPDGSSGTLVAVLGGEVVHCRGWGRADRAAAEPARCDTVYDIMSMTKQFTAAAILKLQMQGELSTDDPVGDHLGGVPPGKAGITLHHLLTHTSGLPEQLGGDTDPVSRDALADQAWSAPLHADPGSGYLYSNLGYSLLAAVIEEASGAGYEDYLREHLFVPAGMEQTGYAPAVPARDIAVEYGADGTPHGRPDRTDIDAHWNLMGNGGMLSSARDMARWHLTLDTDRVLDAAARRQLFTPHVREEPGGATHYAYGWVIDPSDSSLAWHNGANTHSYGELARDPDSHAMLFWATNQSRNTRHNWNLEDQAPDLTAGVLERLRAS